AAVDEQVARLADVHELVQVVIRRSAGRQHEPDVARWCELLNQVLERGSAHGAVADRLLDWTRTAVESDDLVAAERQAVNHIAAHAAKPDEAKLHIYSISS